MIEQNYADRIFSWKPLVLGRKLTTEEKEEIVQTHANKLIAWLYDPVLVLGSTTGWRANGHSRRFALSACPHVFLRT